MGLRGTWVVHLGTAFADYVGFQIKANTVRDASTTVTTPSLIVSSLRQDTSKAVALQ